MKTTMIYKSLQQCRKKTECLAKLICITYKLVATWLKQ